MQMCLLRLAPAFITRLREGGRGGENSGGERMERHEEEVAEDGVGDNLGRRMCVCVCARTQETRKVSPALTTATEHQFHVSSHSLYPTILHSASPTHSHSVLCQIGEIWKHFKHALRLFLPCSQFNLLLCRNQNVYTSLRQRSVNSSRFRIPL